MSTRSLGTEPGWQWHRVVAWSGSVTTHVLAGALLLLPLAEPMLRDTRAENTPTLVELRDETPPPPQPPEPTPPPRSRPVRATVPLPPTRTETSPAIEAPTTAPAPTAPAGPVPSAAAPAMPTTAGAPSSEGAAQTLAYAGVLKTVYPSASARAREQGSVLLRVLVDATGAVQEVRIQRSSGHARLDAAAREAVMHGRFRPVMRDGEAIPAWGLVPIEFRLDRA